MNDEIRPQLAPGYDWKKSLAAAGKDLAHSLIGVVSFAAVTFLANPDSLKALTEALPTNWAPVAGLFASAFTAYARNALKNMGRG